MRFLDFSKAVAKRFQSMTTTGLYRVNIDKEEIWNTYLASFPDGTNPIYVKRTEHDCSCCRSFIRTIGNVVSIVDGAIVSIWDTDLDGTYRVVTDSMAAFVKLKAGGLGIDNLFLHPERVVGVANSRQLLEDKTVKTWEHFFVNLPDTAVRKEADIGPFLSNTRATHDVMLRSLKEISTDSVDTVLDLIAQNSLYRGEEHKFALDSFNKVKREFDKLKSDQARDLFCWSRFNSLPPSVSRIHGTAIGTLLTDLAEGKEMERAVLAFEAKVAPQNYKRPSAFISKAMIQKAQAKIEELGFSTALDRRYATLEDITINNILFANRETKKVMNVFDDLVARVPEKSKNLDKIEDVSIGDFINKILPKASALDVMVENCHVGNFVSLIAPVDPTAKCMFKWPNNFSWSYAGELTDSIKERVKRAGGKVDGDFRASLSWHNHDDLDLSLLEPDGNRIFFGSKYSRRTDGQLDVDMNAGGGSTRTAVENITYPTRSKMLDGNYVLTVNNYCQREKIDVGFEVEMEFDGKIYNFTYEKAVGDKQNVCVAKFKYGKKTGLEIVESLPTTQASRVVWGIPTQTFRKVDVLMLSPNHWDEKPVGNKHFFFMLNGCANEGKARGIFNEFLTSDLDQHRKVFEQVGARMKTEESDRQLSGIGFSSTQRNYLLCRVKGSFDRTIKITF